MYLILSIFIAIILGSVLFFLGNYGLIIGFGILVGTFFRMVFLLEKISEHINSPKDNLSEVSNNRRSL